MGTANGAAAGWLEHALRPSSVALVGASSDPVAIAGRMQRYLTNYGYHGTVYPVNPKREEVQGLKAYSSISEIPGPVDYAMITIRSELVPDAIRDCGKAGIPVVYIGSQGFAESGSVGEKLEAEIVATAREYGMRILGPNGNGIISARSRFTASFTPGLDQEDYELEDGPLALVTQSGALGSAIFYLGQMTGVGTGVYVATGNEADVTLEEVVAELVRMDDISAVLGYVEGLRNYAGLIDAAAEAWNAGKQVVFLRAGTTSEGAEAAESHTAILAGEHRVYSGVMTQLGIVNATSTTSLLNMGRILRNCGDKLGRRLSVVTQSGGLGILLADLISEHGLSLASIPKDTGIDMYVTPHRVGLNPIDVGGDIFFDFGNLRSLLSILDQNPTSDMTILALTNYPKRQVELARFFESASAELKKPLIIVWAGSSAKGEAELNQAGVPCFVDPAECIDALAPVVRRAMKEKPAIFDAMRAESPSAQPSNQVIEMIEAAVELDHPTIDEVDGKRILADYGIAVPREITVNDPEQCSGIEEILTTPLVAKLRSRDVIHKSDIGGVILNLAEEKSVREATVTLMDIAARHDLSDADVVIQEQVPTGLELLLGMKRDLTFGPVLLLGMGGFFADAWDDVAIRLPFVASQDIDEMLGDLRHKKLLRGYRGLPPVTATHLAKTVEGFARLVREVGHHFSSIDVNPLLVPPDGRAPVAIDAVFVMQTLEQAT